MTIRHLVAAALLVSAGVAHADAISTSVTPPPSFLSGWTTGNGTDVLGSGVLQGNLNLIGGVAYDSNSTLSDVLYGKAAASVGQVDGQTKIFFKKGIEGNYLLGAGHGILAATLGTGKSVVGSSDGAIITDFNLDNKTVGGGGGGGGGTVSSGGGSGGGSANNGSSGGGTTGGGTGTSTGGSSGGGSGNGAQNGVGNNPISTGDITPPGQVNNPGNGNPFQGIQLDVAEVPEPSSIFLMLAGMLGAGAVTRRRPR